VVLMRLETRVSEGGRPELEGKTIQRRFTDVWCKEGGLWKHPARNGFELPVLLTAPCAPFSQSYPGPRLAAPHGIGFPGRDKKPLQSIGALLVLSVLQAASQSSEQEQCPDS
jgi:hypothetical protein